MDHDTVVAALQEELDAALLGHHKDSVERDEVKTNGTSLYRHSPRRDVRSVLRP